MKPAPRLLPLSLLLLPALVLLAPGPARAEEGAKPERCAAILDDAGEKIGLGISRGQARIELETHPRTGKPRQRSMEVKTTREKGLMRSRVELLAPADVAGTAFLTREREGKADEQHMFLPALGKVRRISGSARKGSFMGTDFAYADLETRNSKDHACTLVGEETLDGKAVWHLSTRPKAPEKSDLYSRAELWVQKATSVPVKIVLYDRDGKLLKVLEVQTVEERDGRWLATESTMKNVQRDTWTRLVLEAIDFDVDFEAGTFTSRSLQRMAR